MSPAAIATIMDKVVTAINVLTPQPHIAVTYITPGQVLVPARRPL
jgi:hypothetical protein